MKGRATISIRSRLARTALAGAGLMLLGGSWTFLALSSLWVAGLMIDGAAPPAHLALLVVTTVGAAGTMIILSGVLSYLAGSWTWLRQVWSWLAGSAGRPGEPPLWDRELDG